MSETFVMVEVGCLECHNISNVLGIYGSEEEARMAFIEHCVERGDGYGPPTFDCESSVYGGDELAKSTLVAVDEFLGRSVEVQVHKLPPTEDIPFLLAEVERLQALDEAITYVRSLYPESVFRPDSDSIDARSADMARRTCDNIRRTAEELRVGKER